MTPSDAPDTSAQNGTGLPSWYRLARKGGPRRIGERSTSCRAGVAKPPSVASPTPEPVVPLGRARRLWETQEMESLQRTQQRTSSPGPGWHRPAQPSLLETVWGWMGLLLVSLVKARIRSCSGSFGSDVEVRFAPSTVFDFACMDSDFQSQP